VCGLVVAQVYQLRTMDQMSKAGLLFALRSAPHRRLNKVICVLLLIVAGLFFHRIDLH
jgi:hypothetical protein